ncbi:hypothetical protein SSP531S_44880 [Streptomyces spongiicola]|uniref:Uncharacterized protein n=1 Tax=Streptomyces spongiicola TaxID=1690221 RepID=A0A388T4B1_9ACTN|nr:hypothetical protein SSP531S_44880 [Streptomyces spongiicola]
MAPENTGSGTAASPTARPARGEVTVVMGPPRGIARRSPRLHGAAYCSERMSWVVHFPYVTYQLVNQEPGGRFASPAGDM